MLKHQKPITATKFNRDGDLLFSSSKDAENYNVLLWDPVRRDIIGSYKGHIGVVYSLDVNHNTTQLMTSGADKTVRLWEVETGRQMIEYEMSGIITCVRWSISERFFLALQPKKMESENGILIYQIDQNLRLNLNSKNQSTRPMLKLEDGSIKKPLTQAEWINLDKEIMSCGEDGILRKWSVSENKIISSASVSSHPTTSLALARKRQLAIACSSDSNAYVFLVSSLVKLKTIKTDRPIHAAALHPKFPLLLLAGGQDSQKVTQTTTSEGKLEVLYFDFAREKLIATSQSSFGPVNSISLTEDGEIMATGGVDSYVRLHYFGKEIESVFEQIEKGEE